MALIIIYFYKLFNIEPIPTNFNQLTSNVIDIYLNITKIVNRSCKPVIVLNGSYCILFYVKNIDGQQ